MYILGISAYYHDSAACLIKDGEILAAAQEERYTGIKHDSSFPKNAVKFCLEQEGLSLEEVDYLVFYEKPFWKFERIIETFFTIAPQGFLSFMKAFPIWIKEKLFLKNSLIRAFSELGTLPKKNLSKKILFSQHHLSHAASAFYPSSFESALIIVLDGVGEWSTTTISTGKGNDIDIREEIVFPHSLGLLYSAFTYFLGFKVNSGEYKLMGLAPYGEPVFRDLIMENLLDLKPDGSFSLNLSYFTFLGGLTMTGKRFEDLFGIKKRPPESVINKEHCDIAASIQTVLEEAILRIVVFAKHKYPHENLCLAGGVALNCVVNGRLLREAGFKDIWIQPAAGDAGGSVGAAMETYFRYTDAPRKPHLRNDGMKGCFLGDEFGREEIKEAIDIRGLKYKELGEADLLQKTVEYLTGKKVVGWFQGRMEFGPRALGNRSILGLASDPGMQKKINQKIKFRESFRPFAPVLLEEDAGKYFSFVKVSPYMLFTDYIKKAYRTEGSDNKKAGVSQQIHSSFPAITHVDYSSRIQTATKETNDKLYRLLQTLKSKTGHGILVNTSFNVRGAPIVRTPSDAIDCFIYTNMDVLVLGNFILERKENQLPEIVERTDLNPD